MQYIRAIILAAVLVASSAPADPPVFSQQNSCCWIASWAQFVYNLKPAVDLMLKTSPTLFSDYEAFKKTAIGQELAQEKTVGIRFDPKINDNVEVEVSKLEECKDAFEKDAVETIKRYLSLFRLIRSGKATQKELDMALEALQKAFEITFGIFSSPAIIPGTKNFIGHPLLSNMIEYLAARDASASLSIVDGLAKDVALTTPYEKLTPTLVVRNMNIEKGLKLDPFFSIDITSLASIPLKNSGQCLQYRLTGLVVNLDNVHWIAFIKDQYDPAEQWWRCDTSGGNRQVTEQEIMSECSQHPPSILSYTVNGCKGQAGDKKPLCDTKTENCNQDNRDIEALARVLWELSK